MKGSPNPRGRGHEKLYGSLLSTAHLKNMEDSGEHREERADHWELKDWVRMVAGQMSIVGGLSKTNGAWKPDETH